MVMMLPYRLLLLLEILQVRYYQQKMKVKLKKNNTLKEKIESSKKEAKTFKKSVEFKEIKKELKEKKQTNGKEEVSFKYLDMTMANYFPPASSNKFVY